MDGNANLGRATLVLMKAQPVADHLFISADGGFHPAACRVARRLLPADPALVGNALEMAVALRGLGLRRRARHGRGTGRYDDRSVGIAVNDGAVEAVLVVGAVTGERPKVCRPDPARG